MAKKVKKTGFTKKSLQDTNTRLNEQVSDLQDDVTKLVAASLGDGEIFDELDDYIEELENQNTALQNSLVDEQLTVQRLFDDSKLHEKADQAILSGLGLILSEVQKLVAERDELKQDNHHLTIQLAAAKDKAAKHENPIYFRKRPDGKIYSAGGKEVIGAYYPRIAAGAIKIG